MVQVEPSIFGKNRQAQDHDGHRAVLPFAVLTYSLLDGILYLVALCPAEVLDSASSLWRGDSKWLTKRVAAARG